MRPPPRVSSAARLLGGGFRLGRGSSVGPRLGLLCRWSLLGRGLRLGGLLRRRLAARRGPGRDLAELDREALDELVEAAHRPVIGEASTPTSWPWSTSRPGQPRDRLDLLDRDVSPSIVPPLNSSSSCSLRKVGERLGGSAASPAHERERGRTLEQLLEVLGAGLVGRALGQRVLDDAQRGVGLAQAAAQLGGLRHRDPAVVDGEDRLRLLDLGGDLLDDRCLLFFVHCIPSPSRKSPPAGGLTRAEAARGSTCLGLPAARRGPPRVSGRKSAAQATAAASSADVPWRAVGSTRTPGPIVVVSVIVWM